MKRPITSGEHPYYKPLPVCTAPCPVCGGTSYKLFALMNDRGTLWACAAGHFFKVESMHPISQSVESEGKHG